MSAETMREALKLADAALSGANMNMAVVRRKIGEALAQAEQRGEVAVWNGNDSAHGINQFLVSLWELPAGTKLYTAPPAPVVPDGWGLAAFQHKWEACETQCECKVCGTVFTAAPTRDAPVAPDDADRLNFLESREASLVTHREENDEGEFAIWWTVSGEVRKIKANSISGHPLGSVRAAIDAAMLASAPQVKP